jgi:hypothetical protein
MVDQVGSEAFIVMGHDLPLQGFLDLGQFLLTLAKVQRKPDGYALGLLFLDLLPLKIVLEGVGPLLHVVELSPCPVALRAEPRLSLLAKPFGHRSILMGFRLQRSNVLLGCQLQPLLLLKLGLEVEDLLAGHGIPLMQLIALPHGLRGILTILACPLGQVRDHLLCLLGVMMSLCLSGPEVGRLHDEVVPTLFLPMKEQRLVLGTRHQRLRNGHKLETRKQEAVTRAHARRTSQGSATLFSCFNPSFATTTVAFRRCTTPPMIPW